MDTNDGHRETTMQLDGGCVCANRCTAGKGVTALLHQSGLTPVLQNLCHSNREQARFS